MFFSRRDGFPELLVMKLIVSVVAIYLTRSIILTTLKWAILFCVKFCPFSRISFMNTWVRRLCAHSDNLMWDFIAFRSRFWYDLNPKCCLLIFGNPSLREKNTSIDQRLLSQNNPNPFNPTTTIEFSTPHRGFCDLSIFNTLGEKISTLVSKVLDAGHHKFKWNAINYPSGIYFYQLSANNLIQSRKMVFMK